MQTVEFEAPIVNGMVQIPQEFKELKNRDKATFVVKYQPDNPEKDKKEDVIQELERLFSNSNNKVMVTMDIATDTSEMIEDGLLGY